MKNFYILDGSGYVYRAYHALPTLNNKDGNNINAIFGFFRMVLSLYKDKPSYFLIAFDSKEKSFRHKQFEEYKAQRPQMTDNFRWQLNTIKQIVSDIKMPYLEIPLYEADDIIYSIVEYGKISYKDIFFNIISQDKDLKQLLDDNVVFIDEIKQKVITKESFQKSNGFLPKLIADYLALVGDNSDNIPGCKGIGPKTATDLILNYGSIENIYKNIDFIDKGVKQKLIEHKDDVIKSYELTKLYLVDNLKGYDINNFKLNFDFALYKEVLVDRYNFKSILNVLMELKNIYLAGNQATLF